MSENPLRTRARGAIVGSTLVACCVLGACGRTRLAGRDDVQATGGSSFASGVGGTEAIASTPVGGNLGTGGAVAPDAASTGPVVVEGLDALPMPEGTCLLQTPYLPTYYPGDPGFPCPDDTLAMAASLSSPRCPSSLRNKVQCIFAAPDRPGSQYQCFCLDWWSCFEQPCRRPVDACLADVLPSGPSVELSGTCADRRETACKVGTDQTAQGTLDSAVYDVFWNCGARCWLGGTLAVYFDHGCATRFALGQDLTWGINDTYPNDAMITCIKQQLETVSFDCARDFVCGVGSVPTIAPAACILP
jgi:hypothetical protein